MNPELVAVKEYNYLKEQLKKINCDIEIDDSPYFMVRFNLKNKKEERFVICKTLGEVRAVFETLYILQ